MSELKNLNGPLHINQAADSAGLKIYGYDDRSGYSGNIYLDSNGNLQINQTHGTGTGYIQIAAENYLALSASALVYTESQFRIYDAGSLTLGSGGDYKIKYYDSNDTLVIHTNDNYGITLDNAGNATFTGNLTVTGNQAFNGLYIEGDGKEMFRYSDAWLRINEDNDFTSGIYCGSGILRTDGQFQIGGSGQYAKITASGVATFAGSVTATSLDINGSADISGTITSSVNSTTGRIRGGGSGQLHLGDDSDIISIGRTNELWTLADVDSDQTLYVNYRGYNNAATRFRSLDIRDGKGAQIALFNGTDKSTTFAGGVTIPDYITHAGDTDTKFGFSGADTFAVNTGGANRFYIVNSQARFDPSVRLVAMGGLTLPTSDTFTHGKTATAFFEKSFANGTANLGCILQFPNQQLQGYLRITLTGSYSNQDMVGRLVKTIPFGFNQNGSIWHAGSDYSVDSTGPVGSNFTIGDIVWNSTTSTYDIPIYHIVSTGNVARIRVEYYGASSEQIDNVTCTNAASVTIPSAYAGRMATRTTEVAEFTGNVQANAGLKVVGPASHNTIQSANDYTLGFNDSAGTNQWWIKNYTNGGFALHENGVGDKFTIAAGGNATFAGNITAGANSVTAGSFIIGGHTISDVNVAGEFNDVDTKLMTAAAIQDKILSYGYGTGGGSGNGDMLLGTAQNITASKEFQDSIKLFFGNDQDLQIFHDGADAVIRNGTGHVYFDNLASNKDIYFRGSDAGSTITALQLDMSDAGTAIFNHDVAVNDSGQLRAGNGGDLYLLHDATNSYLQNETGDLYIQNGANGKDIILRSDNGTNGQTAYITLDGSDVIARVHVPLWISEYIVHIGDTNTYFGFSAADTFVVHAGATGHAELTITGTTATFAGDVSIPVAKRLYFGGGSHTYIVEDVDDRLRFVCGGDEHIRFTDGGNGDRTDFYRPTYFALAATFAGTIGSGAITSTGKITGTELEGTSLDINGNADISGNLSGVDTYTGQDIALTIGASGSGRRDPFTALHASNNTITISQFGQSHAASPAANQIGVSNAEQHLHLITDSSANMQAGTSTKGIFLRSGGNVGIGTKSPGAKLDVAGEVQATSLDINGNADISGTLNVHQGVEIADVIDGEFTALRLMNQKTYGSGTGTNEKVRFVMGISESGISFAGREGFAIDLGISSQSDSSDGIVLFKVRDGGTLGTYQTVNGSDKSVAFAGGLTVGGVANFNGSETRFNPDANSSAKFLDVGTNAIGLYAGAGDGLYLGANNAASMYFASGVDATFLGTLTIPDYIIHDSDANTFFGFNSTDQWNVTAGGNVGIQLQSTGVYLYFGGSEKLKTVTGGVTITGTLTATADVIAYSDERLKENVQTLDGKKVLEMRGVSFDRLDDGKSSSGVIAQELEKVAPELVVDDGDYKGVAYGNLVGYLIEAVKDQQKQIDELKAMINGNS